MDFKTNLKGVKAKTEEGRKGNSTPQVDFRAVLGKKGSLANKTADPPAKNDGDFRSLLSNKKKPAGSEKNGEKSPENNCVDQGVNKNGAGTAGRAAEGAAGAAAGGAAKAPEFVEQLSDVTVLDGQRLRLQCRLAADQLASVTVTWTLDGKIIKPSKFIVLANEGQRLNCLQAANKLLKHSQSEF